MSHTVYEPHNTLAVSVGVGIVTLLALLASSGLLATESLARRMDTGTSSTFDFYAEFGTTGLFAAWIACVVLIAAMTITQGRKLKASFFLLILLINVFYFGAVLLAVAADLHCLMTCIGPIT